MKDKGEGAGMGRWGEKGERRRGGGCGGRIMVLERLVQAGEGQPLAEGALHSSHVGKNGPTNASICQWWGGQQGEGMTST